MRMQSEMRASIKKQRTFAGNACLGETHTWPPALLSLAESRGDPTGEKYNNVGGDPVIGVAWPALYHMRAHAKHKDQRHLNWKNFTPTER